MNKPDWKDSPEEANYLAQDRDGDWYWWTVMPRAATHLWIPESGDDNEAIPASASNEYNETEGWDLTLEARPSC